VNSDYLGNLRNYEKRQEERKWSKKNIVGSILILLFLFSLLIFTTCPSNMPKIKSDYMAISTYIGSSNCYFVTNKQTRETIIIDPGSHAEYLIRMLEENELEAVAILLTHAHFDHIGAAEQLRVDLDIPIYAHIDEKVNFGDNIVANNMTWLDDEDALLEIAEFSIRVMYTPGHTVGSVCYYIESENVLFSGDTMFWRTYGRTDFPTGNLNAMIDSFVNILYTLPNETIVYPGHERTTTIGYEKKSNPLNNIITNP